MTTKAYVLIETVIGKSRDVSDTLASIAGIKNVDAVTGQYDIIATVEAPDLNEVSKIVVDQIHIISGIMRTVTCLTVEPDQPNST